MAGELILIVEDDRAVARGLEYALQAAGFDVLIAETGTELNPVKYSVNVIPRFKPKLQRITNEPG